MSIKRWMDTEDVEYIWMYICIQMCIYSFGIMDFSRCMYMHVYIWNTYTWSSYMYVYIYIYTHTHTHTQWNVYSAIKRNKIVWFREMWMGLETLIQSEVSQNEECFSDRENRWQAKWNKKSTWGCAKDWMSVSLQNSRLNLILSVMVSGDKASGW